MDDELPPAERRALWVDAVVFTLSVAALGAGVTLALFVGGSR